MYLSKQDIENTPRIKRLNLINSVTGVKPANLIGSVSKSGQTNVAIFSSVVHLGSRPALLGFFLRPQHEVRRDTYENILQTSCFTINQVHPNFMANAHYTSAKFEHDESEFEKCQLKAQYIDNFEAPFVEQSRLKIGLRLKDIVPISLNNCSLIIGSIEHLMIDDDCVNEQGEIDLELLKTVGIGGLNRYYKLEEVAQFPYARPHELPHFG